MKPNFTEIHNIKLATGHLLSRDCWCEPTIRFSQDEEGQKVINVDHCDWHDVPHAQVLTFYAKNEDFISQFLSTIKGI